eukprot:UN28242
MNSIGFVCLFVFSLRSIGRVAAHNPQRKENNKTNLFIHQSHSISLLHSISIS